MIESDCMISSEWLRSDNFSGSQSTLTGLLFSRAKLQENLLEILLQSPNIQTFALTTKYPEFVEKLDAFRAETRKKLLQASKSLKRKQEDL